MAGKGLMVWGGNLSGGSASKGVDEMVSYESALEIAQIFISFSLPETLQVLKTWRV